MEINANAVPAKFRYHAVTVLACKRGNGSADIADKGPRLAGFHAAAHTFFGNGNQILIRFGNLANHKHARSIGIIAVVNSGYINVNNIAAFKHRFIGNTVANLVINRSADAFRKAVKTEAGRNTAAFGNKIIRQRVNFFRCHAGFNFLGNQIKAGIVNLGCRTDAFNLFRRFYHIHIGNFAAFGLEFGYFCFYYFNIHKNLL